jgi:hypothetical protein
VIGTDDATLHLQADATRYPDLAWAPAAVVAGPATVGSLLVDGDTLAVTLAARGRASVLRHVAAGRWSVDAVAPGSWAETRAVVDGASPQLWGLTPSGHLQRWTAPRSDPGLAGGEQWNHISACRSQRLGPGTEVVTARDGRLWHARVSADAEAGDPSRLDLRPIRSQFWNPD